MRWGKKDESDKHPLLTEFMTAPENPTKEELIRALAQINTFILTVQVDQMTKQFVITWMNTINNYLRKSTDLAKDIEEAAFKEENR